MPQFVYDDIKKKIIKREIYKFEAKNFRTAFRILKEHTASFKNTTGYKRFIRLVKFSGILPANQSNTNRQPSFAVPNHSGKAPCSIDMDLQCTTFILHPLAGKTNDLEAIVQKNPYNFIDDSLKKTSDDVSNPLKSIYSAEPVTKGLVAKSEDGLDPDLSSTIVYPDAPGDPTYTAYGYVFGETALEEVQTAVGAFTPQPIAVPNPPWNNILYFTGIDTVKPPPVNTIYPPLIPKNGADEDGGLAINHTLYNGERKNGLYVSRYQFYPTTTGGLVRGGVMPTRASATATALTTQTTSNNLYLYTDDKGFDTQMLTEIPMNCGIVNATFWKTEMGYTEQEITQKFQNHLKFGSTLYPLVNMDYAELPSRCFKLEPLDLKKYTVWRWESGVADTTRYQYTGIANENPLDPEGTMRYEIHRLNFSVIFEVLLVDLKLK